MSWWNRNGTELQTLASIALIVVTAVYVILTAKLVGTSKNQADIAKRGLEQADKVLAESVKARLSAVTPMCTVLFQNSAMHQFNGTNVGNVLLDDNFDTSQLRVEVHFTFRNDGATPSIISKRCVTIDDNSIDRVEWIPAATGIPLMKDSAMSVECLIYAFGTTFRQWASNHKEISLRFETMSPVTEIIDSFEWTGTFAELAVINGINGPVFDSSKSQGFDGPVITVPARTWPGGIDELTPEHLSSKDSHGHYRAELKIPGFIRDCYRQWRQGIAVNRSRRGP